MYINEEVNPMSYQTITRQQLKDHLDAGKPLTLVEALPRRHYDAGHLPGAINIPHDQIRERAAAELPDKDATIVVYCANSPCRNSQIAAEALAGAGYTRVFEYVDGKEDWEQAGYPLTRAAA
jgi:rhodanese-related sulfurtransferase